MPKQQKHKNDEESFLVIKFKHSEFSSDNKNRRRIEGKTIKEEKDFHTKITTIKLGKREKETETGEQKDGRET